MARKSEVELGFLEKSPAWRLKSKFFSSKVGGKPSWLALTKLPEISSLLCRVCNKPCTFLMQVYAPIENSDEAFHRTIFLFMCMNGKCCEKFNTSNLVVVRSQLPRQNEYYDFEPPVEIEAGSDLPSAGQFQTLCDICGFKSSVKCDHCTGKNYCSEVHRLLDFESGHKDLCGKEPAPQAKNKKKNHLLPEYELVTETEVLPTQAKERSDEEKMKDYQEFMRSARAKNCLQDSQVDDIENFVKKPDKLFCKFQKRVAHEPDQVLRYQKGGEPLCISSEHTPTTSDIPNCNCGANRTFEFQIMPQLLNHLSLDSIGQSVDWGTIIVYTCSKSCSLGTASYTEEFAWKQDISDDVEKY